MPIEKRNRLLKTGAIALAVVFFVVVLAGIVINALLFPKLSINGDTYVKVPYGEEYTELGCSASYMGDDISETIEYDGEVDEAVVGIYNLKCIVTKNNITIEKERKVEVADDVAPIVKIKGKDTIKMCPNDEYIEEGYSAEDNYDGDLTNLVKVKKGTNRIVYSVRDSSNNEGRVVRILDKKDEVYPVLNLDGQLVYNIELNSNYVEPGFSANDNCDFDITDKVEIDGKVDSSKEGTYVLTYSVSDGSGNITKKERVINVKKNIYSDSDVSGRIYLTFDDGPSRGVTPKILDLLKEKEINATFFVTNRDDSLNDIIKRAYDEENTIGIESYSSSYKVVYSSVDDFFEDLDKISNKVEKITGEKPTIMRFIGGSSNTVSRKYSKGIMSKLVKKVLEDGYHYFDWNVESHDDERGKTTEDIYKSVINGLSKDKENVILMHDYEDCYKTVEALEKIIDYGLEHGYEFKAIDMSVPMVKHRVNN